MRPAKTTVVVAVLGLSLAGRPAPAMSLQQGLDALGALQALDGHEQVVKEAGAERSVKVPYQLSGLVRLGIARDLSRLRLEVDHFQAARKAKIQEMNPTGSELKPGSSEERALIGEITKMLAVEVSDEGLAKFTAADLGLLAPTNNPIPASVLAGLGPLFDTEVKGQASAAK